MIQIDQIKIPVEETHNINDIASKRLKLDSKYIDNVVILKKSIDARKKPDLFYVYSLGVSVSTDENKILKKMAKDKNIHVHNSKEYSMPKAIQKFEPPIIVGAGPAGLFAAYILALNGLNPIIFERGKKVDDRTSDIIKFWETGILDTSSNVQFGEGGAGTFSDGKLNTLVNDKFGRNKFVLETFVKFGAPEKILYEGKPHIGTDILKNVIASLRDEIIRLGGTFYFNTLIDDIIISNNKITAVKANNITYPCSTCILAIGHSARDTFFMLHDKGIYMEAKDFAVGFRIEHPQEDISRSMYGTKYYLLEPAAYKLATNLDNGRGVYSFCMCPGGFVVNSSSEKNRLVVNGMSYSKRDSNNANSAIVVSVGQNEFDKNDPLSAIKYQRDIEEKAFNLCSGKIPQQLFGDFKANVSSREYGDFTSETKGMTDFANLRDIFSQEINQSIIDAMSTFGHKIKGYDRYDAILSGIESRTSSPVRINRNELFNSNIQGIYPCGEGAGYAGGITSAAMDGIKVAEAVINSINLN